MPQTETTMDHEGLNLRYRTSEIRFVLDERRFAHFRGRFTLRCLAIIEKIPFSKREAQAFVYIQSDLNNERYTNPNSSCKYILSFATMKKSIHKTRQKMNNQKFTLRVL